MEQLLLAMSIRAVMKFMGFAVLGIALLAWFVHWIRDKID